MKKWYFIADAFVFVGLIFLVLFPYVSLIRNNIFITLLFVLIAFAIFVYAIFKDMSHELKAKEFSAREEDFYIASGKVTKMYVSTSTSVNGFFLMIASVVLLAGSLWSNQEFPFAMRILIALWVFFFIMIASRNSYYEKVVFRKNKQSTD